MECLTNHPGWQFEGAAPDEPGGAPDLRAVLHRRLSLAAIMEDLPYLDNRVLPCDRASSDGRQRLRLQYRFHPSEIERRTTFLRQLKELFEPFRNSRGAGRDRQLGPRSRLRHVPFRYRSQN